MNTSTLVEAWRTKKTLQSPLSVIQLRGSELTNIPFYISSSGHLCRLFNHKILSVALLRLRFCSIRGNKFDLNLSAKLGISVSSEYLTVFIRK
jgi:hypothetical protein